MICPAWAAPADRHRDGRAGQNNALAAHNREHFEAADQLVLNLVSARVQARPPLLCETLRQLAEKHPCAVIEGDQQTSADADRIRATGVPAVQINTGKGCHLDAKMVHDACHQLPANEGGILFIENVGNLVCPPASISARSTRWRSSPSPRGREAAEIPGHVRRRPADGDQQDRSAALCRLRCRPAASRTPNGSTPYIPGDPGQRHHGEGMDAWLNWLARPEPEPEPEPALITVPVKTKRELMPPSFIYKPCQACYLLPNGPPASLTQALSPREGTGSWMPQYEFKYSALTTSHNKPRVLQTPKPRVLGGQPSAPFSPCGRRAGDEGKPIPQATFTGHTPSHGPHLAKRSTRWRNLAQ